MSHLKNKDSVKQPEFYRQWTKSDWCDTYNQWIEHVKSNVPAENLLVFNAKQGWEPLCTFLNVPIPTVPYPSSNNSTKFHENFSNDKIPS